jgi:hypothetical protein
MTQLTERQETSAVLVDCALRLTKANIRGDDFLLISEFTPMPKLVEDAGGELSAGYVYKLARLGREHGGELIMSGRLVRWELTTAGVSVEHPAAALEAGPLAYVVPTVTTELPSGGLRRWWACPACGQRCDALYLPAGRDRLACRRCCGLTYRSQQTAGPVPARKERPGLWSERTYEKWEYSPAAMRLCLVVRRRTRRRL